MAVTSEQLPTSRTIRITEPTRTPEQRVARDFFNSTTPIEDLRSKSAPLTPSIVTVGSTKLLTIPHSESQDGFGQSGVAIYTAPGKVKRFHGTDEVTIGRAKDVEMTIPKDETVTREHASIRTNPDGSHTIVDLISTHGTQIQPIPAMKDGDRRDLTADEWIRIKIHDGLDTTLSFVSGGGHVDIRVLEDGSVVGPMGEPTLPEQGLFYIGSDVMSAIPLPDQDAISTQHVVCIREGNELLVKRISDTASVKMVTSANGERNKVESTRGTVHGELEYWRNAQLPSGDSGLKITTEGEDAFDQFTEMAFVAPKGTKPALMREIAKVVNQVSGEIRRGAENNTAVTPIAITLVPGRTYPRRGAAGEGRMIIEIGENVLGTAAHEGAHVVLDEEFGRCFLDFVAEGTAMYFEGKYSPEEIRKYKEGGVGAENFGLVGGDQVGEIASHTSMVENFSELKLTEGAIYDHSYLYGLHFVEYMVEQFGFDTFLEFYAHASSNRTPTLINEADSTVLVDGGERLGTHRDITRALLDRLAGETHRPDLQADVFIPRFNEYLRDQSTMRSGAL